MRGFIITKRDTNSKSSVEIKWKVDGYFVLKRRLINKNRMQSVNLLVRNRNL